MTENPTCESCTFPEGARTGAIRTYRLKADGTTIVLCDDCVSHGPELVEAVAR